MAGYTSNLNLSLHEKMNELGREIRELFQRRSQEITMMMVQDSKATAEMCGLEISQEMTDYTANSIIQGIKDTPNLYQYQFQPIDSCDNSFPPQTELPLTPTSAESVQTQQLPQPGPLQTQQTPQLEPSQLETPQPVEISTKKVMQIIEVLNHKPTRSIGTQTEYLFTLSYNKTENDTRSEEEMDNIRKRVDELKQQKKILTFDTVNESNRKFQLVLLPPSVETTAQSPDSDATEPRAMNLRDEYQLIAEQKWLHGQRKRKHHKEHKNKGKRKRKRKDKDSPHTKNKSAKHNSDNESELDLESSSPNINSY
jgi:hypothetical protein